MLNEYKESRRQSSVTAYERQIDQSEINYHDHDFNLTIFLSSTGFLGLKHGIYIQCKVYRILAGF